MPYPPSRRSRLIVSETQAAASAVVFHLSHMGLSVGLKWLLVQRLPEVDGVCRTTSWLGIRKQVISRYVPSVRSGSE